MRLFLPAALILMLLVVACGDDDGGGASVTPTDAVSVTTPAPTPSPSPGDGTPRPTFRPVEADYLAVSSEDVGGYYLRVLDVGEIAQAVPNCTYDEPNIIIDCTSSGVGTIALDIAPVGVVTECRGLIKPTTNRLFAASCNVEDGGAFIYEVHE